MPDLTTTRPIQTVGISDVARAFVRAGVVRAVDRVDGPDSSAPRHIARRTGRRDRGRSGMTGAVLSAATVRASTEPVGWRFPLNATGWDRSPALLEREAKAVEALGPRGLRSNRARGIPQRTAVDLAVRRPPRRLRRHPLAIHPTRHAGQRHAPAALARRRPGPTPAGGHGRPTRPS
jgi:hypothetical protein